MSGLKIHVEQGRLLGCACETQSGFKYNAYRGIPYAKPPVGDLRFKDPQPADNWIGVRDATKEGSPSAQYDPMLFKKFLGSEDSLFLNVFVPEDNPYDTKFPVMVWIHGGAFQAGSGDMIMYGPDFLIEHNVIVVTLNYRLGVLGFLCLHNPEVPGNAGLKDQVMALKWVRNNIGRFGGDKDNVTVFGESAGSGSVHLLMMSPMARGLFKRTIMQSGCAINPWCMQYAAEESSFALARKLGLITTDKKKVIDYLRKFTAEELSDATKEGFQLTDRFYFCPTVEKTIPGVQSFIQANPMCIMKSGDYNRMPFIMGFNSKEGVLFLTKNMIGDVDCNQFTKFEELNLDILSHLPEHIRESDPQIKSAIIEKIKNFYFTPDQHIVEGYVNFMTDACFFLGTVQSVNLMSRACYPAYYYQFKFNGSLNLVKNMVTYNYTESAHADELGYMFKPDYEKLQKLLTDEPQKEIKLLQSDAVMIKRLTTMWTNYAKTGVPILGTSELFPCIWEPIKLGSLNCFNIGETMEMEDIPLKERWQFWKEITKK